MPPSSSFSSPASSWPPSLAQTPRGCDPGGWQPGDGTQFSAVGTVSAAPVADGGGGGTISMAVDHGCPNLDGSTITVNVADHAQLFSVADCQRSPIDFSGISQGDEVALCGTIDASSGSPVYDASRVCVRQPEFSCTGTVSAVDTTNDLLTVNVTKGSAGLASPLTVAITSNTQITGDASTVSEASPVAALRCDDNTITLNQVIVAEQVRICGTIDDSSGTPVYDASRVWVRQARFFCEGAVSQIDTTNDRLSVDVAHGSAGLSGTTALAISADTQLFSFADFACGQIDLSQVSVGDQVAVCGTIDASSGTAVYDARRGLRLWRRPAAGSHEPPDLALDQGQERGQGQVPQGSPPCHGRHAGLLDGRGLGRGRERQGHEGRHADGQRRGAQQGGQPLGEAAQGTNQGHLPRRDEGARRRRQSSAAGRQRGAQGALTS